MVKVGVIGVGSMGTTHLDAYARVAEAQVVAVADLIEERRTGRASAKGNIEGQAVGGHDFSSFAQYDEGHKLIADPNVELVDVCLPTPLHHEFVLAALAAGKHVCVEKPFALNSQQAAEMVAAAEKGPGLLMCALCMRFWPAWAWLKEAVDAGTYGPVRSAFFRRVASHPGRSFYLDGAQSGGAALDLHVHDADFVQYVFGLPEAVYSRGYSKPTSAVDHQITHYLYPNIPLVIAEGGWAMQAGYGFKMQYEINFEDATVVFDISQGENQLKVIRDGNTEVISAPGAGYEYELRYLVDCIQRGVQPVQASAASAADTVRLVEAEVASVRSGEIVRL